MKIVTAISGSSKSTWVQASPKKPFEVPNFERLCGPSWDRMRLPDYEFQIEDSIGLHRFVSVCTIFNVKTISYSPDSNNGITINACKGKVNLDRKWGNSVC